MRRTWIPPFLGASVAALVAGYVYLAPSAPSVGKATAMRVVHHGPFSFAPETPAISSGGRAPGCAFPEGWQGRYQVSVDTRADVDGSALAVPSGQSLTLSQETRFHLNLEALSEDEGGTVLLARMSEFRTNTDADPRRVSEPFLLRIAPDCAVVEYARHRRVHRADGRVQQALSSELVFRWTEEARNVVTESDALGNYEAVYAHAGDATHAQVQRRAQHYTSFWHESPFGADPDRSLTHIALGQGPWFERLSGSQTLRGQQGWTSTIVQAVLEPAMSDALRNASREVDDYVWENLLPRSDQRRRVRAISAADRRRQAAVAHQTFDETMASFRGRVQSNRGFQDTWPALTDYLEARPAAASTLVEEMRRGELSPEASTSAYVALARARTPEALHALRDVMEDEAAPVVHRTRAMFALIDRDDVDASDATYMASKAALIHRSEEAAERMLGREATLALGALAGFQEDDAIAQIAKDTVQNVLASGETALELRPAFGAIGNMGEPSMLAVVAPFVQSEDADIRAAAARAIRGMAPVDTEAFVANWLLQERDAIVKRNVYRVMSRQYLDAHASPSGSLCAQAIDDLRNQPGYLTRVALIELLGRSAAQSEDVRDALLAQREVEAEYFEEDPQTSAIDVIDRVLRPEGGMQP